VSLEPWVREILRCPTCAGELTDREALDDGGTLVSSLGPVGSWLACAVCAVAYPIIEGIPVLLADEAVEC